MRKVLVSLMVLSLVPALVTAATNPEGFEGYALTTDWGTGENGWTIGKMYDVEGGQLASIVDDGGNQILDINSQGGYGMVGFPMWDADGPADAAFAVTKSGFDFKPLGGSMGSEFVAKFARHSDADSSNYGAYPNPAYHSTWEVGIRVSIWNDFQSPFSPYMWADTWNSTGTYVYLRTWVGPDETYTETEIPGFGEGVFIVPGIPAGETGTPPDITSEWYTMEIEEDNATQQTRARMYLKGGTTSAWTPWQAHNGDITYAGTEGQVFGFIGGSMQFDNWYITGEGDPPPAFLPGDANNDGLVSADDYASVQSNFGNTGAVGIPGDANGDGLVSADDYASVQSHFGDTAGVGGVPVPEPATMGLLVIGGLAMLKRRRK